MSLVSKMVLSCERSKDKPDISTSAGGSGSQARSSNNLREAAQVLNSQIFVYLSIVARGAGIIESARDESGEKKIADEVKSSHFLSDSDNLITPGDLCEKEFEESVTDSDADRILVLKEVEGGRRR
ncbi:hypothetical protein Tco_0486692 [Tanacetum coccineum]